MPDRSELDQHDKQWRARGYWLGEHEGQPVIEGDYKQAIIDAATWDAPGAPDLMAFIRQENR